MGCGETVMKVVLVILNIIFLLIGGIMLAFGITALASPNLIGDIFSKIIPNDQYEQLEAAGIRLSEIVASNAVFMIILGVVVFVVATFGFIGACCMVRWMLVVYGIVLIIVLLAEIALIIFAAVYTETFNEKVQDGMFTTLKEKYRSGARVLANQSVILPSAITELSWDVLQFKEKCCGAYNYTDYRNFNWTKTNIVAGLPGTAAVPLSCCKLSPDVSEPSSITDFENIQACLGGNSTAINSENCFNQVSDKIKQFISQYKTIAIGIAAAIVGIEIILIIFAFCLCARAGKEDKYV